MSSPAYLRQRKKILEEREKQRLELEQLLGVPVPVWPGWRTCVLLRTMVADGRTVEQLRQCRRQDLLELQTSIRSRSIRSAGYCLVSRAGLSEPAGS